MTLHYLGARGEPQRHDGIVSHRLGDTWTGVCDRVAYALPQAPPSTQDVRLLSAG